MPYWVALRVNQHLLAKYKEKKFLTVFHKMLRISPKVGGNKYNANPSIAAEGKFVLL